MQRKLIFSFSSCASEKKDLQESSEEITEVSSQENGGEAVNDSSDSGQGRETGNILIVYFSRWGNTEYPDDIDATTSASIVADGDERMGTTEYVADMIADEAGGDIHRIETVTPYTADFDELQEVNHDEMDQNYLPELKESNLDISGYDTVFVGYPVWWYVAPTIINTFLESYDLSGKTIVPFATSGGSGLGNTNEKLAPSCSGARLLKGKMLNDSLSQAELKAWAESL